MLSVISEGSGRHRLENGSGANVGWIRGRVIGFRGLRSKADVIAAASEGWRTLRTVLHGEYAAFPPPEVAWSRLRLVHDGAHEWVSDGRVPLARVYRPGHGAAHGPETGRHFAVEFVLPAWLGDERIVPLAHTLWEALAHLRDDAMRATSGVPLPAWVPASSPGPIGTREESLVG